jgi:protocatechuate 3,4-dioxygenase, beta subunit
MERRMFLAALPVIAAALRIEISEASPVQDLEFIRAYERAQQGRPPTLTSRARIAPAGEPGTPLAIAGRLFGRDGRSPAPGITVFAYHTDAMGHYDVPSNGPHSWRLKGWAVTDGDGRFAFETIRPAPYPGRNVAAHIHIGLEGPRLKRQSAGILFEGDPLITGEERAASSKAGQFGSILPVVVRDGVQHVDYKLRITDGNLF